MAAQQDTVYPIIVNCTTPQPYVPIQGDGTTYETFALVNGKNKPKIH